MAKTNEAAPLSLRQIIGDANLLAQKRKELDDGRRDDMRDWQLNRHFYDGDQWTFHNRISNRVESLPVDDGDKPRYKVRLVDNQIRPGVNNIVAQMTKNKPVIRATPDSGDNRDVKAAQFAERLYEYWWTEFGLKSKLQTALLNAQISQGYWKITWDPYAGKAMRMMTDPQGQLLIDSELSDAFRDELSEMAPQMGIDPGQLLGMFEKVIYMGDLRVEVISGENVWVDPTANVFEDAQWAICKHPMTPDDVKARFKKKVTPNSIPSQQSVIPLAYAAKRPGEKEIKPSTRDVYYGYFRPTPVLPKGRYVVWIEGPNEILFQGDWKEPFTELPLIKFPGIERPDSGTDGSRVTDARPLQKEMNRTISQTIEHKNLTLRPQLLAPFQSLRQRLTTEPGAVIEYTPVAGMEPKWREMPNLPAYVFAHLDRIQVRLDRIFNAVPSERAQLPARIDSGDGIDLIQEAVADQLSTEIQRLEEALARAGTLMAKLAQKYYIEPRLMKIRGSGGSTQVKKFRNADLEGGFSFHSEMGSGLPRSRAGKNRQIRELIEMQIITPQDALPYMDIAGLKGIQSRLEADEDHAYREIEKLIKGEPINPSGMEQAIQIAQSGMNPQTEQPFQSEEELMQFIEMAAMQPLLYENLHTHAEVLRLHMTSNEFEKYPPDVQRRFLVHYQLTTDSLRAIPQLPPMQPVRTTLSLKGTVGPSVAAEILNRSGVPGADPMKMTEPALSTSIYDSLDKPDADSSGNDPLTDMERLTAMQRDEESHMMKTAEATHKVALAEKRARESDFRPRPLGDS